MQQLDTTGISDTHWSRILHYDLFEDHQVEHHQVISLAEERSRRHAAAPRGRSATQAATTRLAIFIGIYMAVAGAVHFLFWPDAAAVVPASSPTHASAANVLILPPVARPLPPGHSIDQDAQRVASPLECSRARGESMVMYD